MSKTCTLCYKKLSLACFYVDKHQRDGHASACKSCRSKQINAAASKRRKKPFQPFQTSDTRLLDHNAKALTYLLSLPETPPEITLRQVGVIDLIKDGIQLKIRNGVRHLLVFTHEGQRSFNLSYNSPEMIANYLESHKLKVILPENKPSEEIKPND